MDLESGVYVPQELINHITDLLQHDSRTILNLCLVSRSFSYSARSSLYRQIRVVNATAYWLNRHDHQVVNFDGCIRFLSTIVVQNPRLGHYVREFHYTPENLWRPGRFWELLGQALHHMIDLKILSFRCFLSPSNLKRELFWGTRFQLQEFYWEDGYSMDHNGELLRFLKTQPELRVLAASLGKSDLRTPLFPKLRTFIGDVDSISQVADTAPLEKLRWRGGSPNGSSECRQIFASLSTLRVLSISISQSTPWIPIAAPYLQALEILHITGSHDNYETRVEFKYLSQLKNLRVFIWSPKGPRVKLYEKDEQGGLVKDFFNGVKCLERIYFYTRNAQAERDGCWCWVRGEPSPVFLTTQQFVKRESIHEFSPLFDPIRLDVFSMN